MKKILIWAIVIAILTVGCSKKRDSITTPITEPTQVSGSATATSTSIISVSTPTFTATTAVIVSTATNTPTSTATATNTPTSTPTTIPTAWFSIGGAYTIIADPLATVTTTVDPTLCSTTNQIIDIYVQSSLVTQTAKVMLNPPRNVPATTGIEVDYVYNTNIGNLGGFQPLIIIEDNSGNQVSGALLTNTGAGCGSVLLPCASSVVIKDIQIILRVIGSQTIATADIKITKIKTY